MIRSAILCLLLAVALYPDVVSAQRDNGEWNNTDLTDGALIGIIIGVIFFVIIVIGLVFMCLCFLANCFQRNDYYYDEPAPYYPPPPPLVQEEPLSVIAVRPRQESRKFAVVSVEQPSPPPRRALLVRDQLDYGFYDPYDRYDEGRFVSRRDRYY